MWQPVFIFTLVSILSLSSFAAVNWSELENLSKQKDPTVAAKKIANIWAEGPHEPKTLLSIQRISNKIFETFYTEKGLNYYEVGKHLAISDPQGAKSTLAKAIELEPFNGKVFLLWARISLSLGECGFSETKTNKLLEVFPLISELQLLIGQDLACQEKDAELETWLKDNEDLGPNLKKYLVHLWIRLFFLQKEETKMEHYLEILTRLDSSFSELDFWHSKISSEDKDYQQEHLEKYTTACANMAEKLRRDRLIEPLTCAAAKDIKGRKKNG